MITAEMRKEARDYLRAEWGDNAEAVIMEAEKVKSTEISSKEFFDHCTACGGNWGGMLLTGIKELFPAVWDAIPQEMGKNAFFSLCHTLVLCGVDTSE